jgi:lipopolysaccharide export system permease protein
VFGSILHRMILKELLKVFLMSLLGITGILLMAGIVAEASQEGLGPAQILAAIPLLVPSTLPYTIPATTLFACCVVYGRLSADNEILAIKSSGVNILQVVRPGLLLGLVAAIVTMGLYYDLIPSTHRMLRQMAYEDAEELLYSMLRKQHSFNIPTAPYGIWVQSVEGRKLIEPVIKGRGPDGKENFVAQAKEAELRVDMARKELIIRMRFGSATTSDSENGAAFDVLEQKISLPSVLEQDIFHRARDMTWPEMLEKRKEWVERIRRLDDQVQNLPPDAAADPAPERPPAATAASDPSAPRQKGLGLIRREQEYLRQQIIWVDVEVLMRPALSLGCFCFVLVGCPVGIWLSRSDYLSSFIVCFLPIVLVYYPLMLCGAGLAKEGQLDPALQAGAVWGADVLLVAVGGLLFFRLLRN